MSRALVLAGGGISGISWEAGVLAGLEAAGFDTRRWDLVVGTSAGAYVGARLTLDGSAAPLFAVQTSGNDADEEAGLSVLFGPGFVRTFRFARRPSLRWVGAIWLMTFIVTTLMRYAIRNGLRATLSLVNALGPARKQADSQEFTARIGAVADTKRTSPRVLVDHWEHALGPGRPWPATRLIATAIDTSDGSRMLFDAASGVPLIDAVAASTCLPGLLTPIRLLGRRFMDGGIGSPTNADVAAGHDEVWIVSPAGGHTTEAEIAELRETGSIVHLIRPSAASEAILPPGLGAFDPLNRLAAARAGFADGRAAATAASKNAEVLVPPSRGGPG